MKSIDNDIALVLPMSASNDVTTVAGWTIQNLNGLAEGTGLGERVGRKISMASLQIRIAGYLGPPVGATLLPYRFGLWRYVLVYDKQWNGQTINSTADAAALFHDPDEITTNLNLNNRDRYLVLMDKVLRMGTQIFNNSPVPAFTTTPEVHYLKKFKKVKGLNVIYNGGNSGNETDIATGALFLFCATTVNSDPTGSGSALVNGWIRCRFADC